MLWHEAFAGDRHNRPIKRLLANEEKSKSIHFTSFTVELIDLYLKIKNKTLFLSRFFFNFIKNMHFNKSFFTLNLFYGKIFFNY